MLEMCPTCNGTGEVHSHNSTCWTCHGSGETTAERAEQSRRAEAALARSLRIWDYS